MDHRIEPIPVDAIENTAVRKLVDSIRNRVGDTVFLSTLGPHLPELMQSFFEFYGQFFREDAPLDLELLELMRIKCYDFNRCAL